MILDLSPACKEEGRVSIIMILHNYVHVLSRCDRVSLIQDGVISLDKPTVGDLGGGADRDRRRRVPARAPSGAGPPGAEPWPGWRAGRASSASTSGRSRHAPSSCARATARSSARRSHEYAHGVIERDAAGHGRARCRPSWALQDPEDWLDVLRDGGAGGGRRRPASSPTTVVGIGTDFTASTPLPVLADGTPLCRLDDFASARTPTRSSGSTTPRSAQAERDQRAWRAERGEPWLARYGGRISSEWEFAKALQVLEEDPEVYDAHGPLDRGRRLDRLAALRPRDAQRVHRRLQGASSRTARYPSEDYLRALDPRLRRLRRARSSSGRSSPLGGRAGGLTRAGRRDGLGLPEGIAVAVGNVDAHVTAPAARGDRARPDARRHGHLDVPRHERRRARRGARHVRRRRRRHHAGPAAATRPARAASATSSPGSSTSRAAALPRRGRAPAGSTSHEHLSELAGEQAPGEHGLVALDWHNGNRSVLVDHELSGADRRADARHARRGRLPRADRGDRVRHAHDRRDVRGGRACPVRELIVAGGLVKNPVMMQIYADVSRRPLHLIDSDAGPGARLGDARRGRRRRHADIHAAAAAMGKRAPRRLRARRRRAPTPTTRSTTHYSTLHDHFGRGGDDVMHAAAPHPPARACARG